MTSPHPVPIEALIQHRSWMQALARRLMHDTWDADDVVQETWLSSLQSPPKRAASARGWLSRVLRNKATDRRRAARSRAAHEGAAQVRGPEPSVDQVVAAAELHRCVAELVTALDEPYRTTVLLRFFEGLAPREVAARLDVPVETVRTRTRRGIERLRAALDARHGGDRTVWIAALAPLARFDKAAAPTAAAGTGLAGVVAMGAKSKLGLAACVTIALGIGAGWFGRAAADDTPVRAAELDGVTKDLASERARSEELTGTLAVRDRRIDDLDRGLAAANDRVQQLEARVGELTQALANAERRADEAVARAAAPDEAAGTAFVFDEYEILGEIDWEGVGKATSELLPLIVKLQEAFATGTQLSAEEMVQVQNHNAPLMAAAMTIAGKLPGVGPNGPYANPAFMANLMAATLAAGGLPLTTEQTTRIDRLARDQLAADAQRAKGWNERTLELRKLYEEVRGRSAFYEGSLKVLTNEQAALLRPPVVRDRVQMDIFGASIQWSMLLRPVRHNGTREHLGKKLAREFERTVQPSEEAHDDLERVIREWAETLPDDLLEVRQGLLEQRGYALRAHVERSAGLALGLLERIAREIPIGDDALQRLRALPGPPVPFSYAD